MSKSSHSASASRYANALFQLAKEAKVLDSISNDLDKIMELLLSDQDFASFIKTHLLKI
jgi:F0F1-type ATP synthase delta subunit